jgi:hypothetical protein
MPDATESMNELTFVARLGTATALRAERKRAAGAAPLIVRGDVEEKQVDSEGRVRRCDIRLSSGTGRKLASGEVKRPEVKEGRDPKNEGLRADARRKAVARGLPYYFTCNMAQVVLYEVAKRGGEDDKEVKTYDLAPVTHSSEVEALDAEVAANWSAFLDDLEPRLAALATTRPSVTSRDVVMLRDAINAIAEEALPRAERRLLADPALAEDTRAEAANSFGFRIVLDPAPK